MGRFALAGCVLLCLLSACRPQPQTTAPPTLDAPPPPPPPSGAFLAQLSPQQTAQLTQLEAEVVVPGQVPPGFQVAAIQADSPSQPGYTLAYRDGQNRCFAIQFTAAGAEALPPAPQSQSLDPPLFAGGSYQLHYEGDAAQPSRLFSDWMGEPAYRLLGAPYIHRFSDLSACQNVDIPTAVQIVESLTVIAPAVIGDGP